MPYIVLATDSIPDGTLQVTDLHPNTSSRHLTTDPPGQTKYINRCENSVPSINTTTGATVLDVRGVSAYLQARVEPCGLEYATATVTMASVNANDTVTIAGVVFTAVTGAATAASRQFQRDGGTNTTTATSLVAAINHATPQGLINTALTAGSITASNAGGTSAVVTLTFSLRGTATTLVNATLASSNGTRLPVSGAYLALTLGVPSESDYAAAAAAIIARVDAGLGLTLANINTALSTELGSCELTSAGGSSSTGTVAELLGILAGRGFKLAAGTALYTRPSTSPLWAGAAGSFTTSGLVNGTTFVDGEWVPSTSGGDTVALELKPIRHTYESASLAISKQLGQLSVLSAFTGTLFPDSDGNVFIPSTYQKSAGHQAPETPSRLVTVYNDDGSLYT